MEVTAIFGTTFEGQNSFRNLESVTLTPKIPDTLVGKIAEAVYLGSQMVYMVEVAENTLIVEVANPQEHMVFKPGEAVTVAFQEKSLHILPYEAA